MQPQEHGQNLADAWRAWIICNEVKAVRSGCACGWVNKPTASSVMRAPSKSQRTPSENWLPLSFTHSGAKWRLDLRYSSSWKQVKVYMRAPDRRRQRTWRMP
uniref:Transposase n=1 Tax=Panagrellus redivivus TaxID=6233 RepID=A0A7E4V8Y7_PANRE